MVVSLLISHIVINVLQKLDVMSGMRGMMGSAYLRLRLLTATNVCCLPVEGRRGDSCVRAEGASSEGRSQKG